jgi:hypothetical protein
VQGGAPSGRSRMASRHILEADLCLEHVPEQNETGRKADQPQSLFSCDA